MISKYDYREACLSAKGEQCSLCDDPSGRIVVHHIDGDRENNDLENLMPVCRGCHKCIHSGSEGYKEWYQKLKPEVRDSYGPDDAAFEFADVQQKAIYPLPDTWQSYQDFLDFEVRRQLREYDITDETGRELDEAALRVLQNHAQEIADEVVALREERQ